ncbi:MAG: methyltransferase, TIGR04325 family [Bacteroidota bacterium]
MKATQLVQQILPPLVYQTLMKIYKSIRNDSFLYWESTSLNWQAAQASCSGYNEATILEKVKHATNEVLAGNAAYERDSVLFDKIEYHWPLVASLEHIYQKQHQLQVLDFGGALGSTYHQHIAVLKNFQQMHWHIIEQENYVTCGKENFTTDMLSFHYTIHELSTKKIDVILFSCVLHYLENPFQFIEEAIKQQIPYLIFDRTPFTPEPQDIISIQHVPAKIYKANYVCRIFAEDPFMQKLLQHYDIIWSWENDIHIDIPCAYKGLFLELKKQG